VTIRARASSLSFTVGHRLIRRVSVFFSFGSMVRDHRYFVIRVAFASQH
jgi:hypothetical protein